MNQFTILYEGKQISSNQMKSLHWRKLKAMIDPVKLQAKVLCINAKPIKMDKFTIEARYNSKLDPDNLSSLIKVFCDQLVKMGVFPDDSKKHWRGLSIIPDESMKHNSLQLTVTECTGT